MTAVRVRASVELVADSTGVPAPAVTPVVTVLAAVRLSPGVDDLAASFPARRAARTRPGVALRAE